ncbi:MAG: hypothetical protein H6584_01045 [Flavobacteriales bacterium]|nr:hypothetical protein [Flavobacteriales bacterium]
MKKIFLVINFLFFNSHSFSQKFSVIDSVFQFGISRVEIYSTDGDLLGLSDDKGVVHESITKSIMNSKSLEILLLHPSYKTQIVKKSKIFEGGISMEPIIVSLDEVVLVEKLDYKYLKVQVYFRSVQINDDRPHYFMDGIADYYISLRNGDIDADITQWRSFQNNNIKQLDTKGKVQVSFLLAGIPYLNDCLEYKNLINDYSIVKDFNSGNILVNKTGQESGVITENERTKLLNLSLIQESNPIKRNGFGNESIQKVDNVTAIYNKNESDTDMSVDNLVYYKELRIYDIKNKKEKSYQSVEATHEVFVLSKQLTNKINKKSLDEFYNFIPNSNYHTDFWQSINNPYHQAYPDSMMLQFEN